jgi:DNA-binding XRE family transcriptional regulator
MFQVEFYETKDGTRPVAAFLDSLDNKMAAKLVGLLEILEEYGPALHMRSVWLKKDALTGLPGTAVNTKERNSQAMNLKEYKAKRMQDPEFAQAYSDIQPEMNVIRALIDARISQGLTQKELSEKTGIAQAEISRLENGTRNPSIRLLQRLADGMDMVLQVTFVPKEKEPASPAGK